MDAVPSLEHVFVSAGGQFDAFPDEMLSTRGRWFAHSGWKRVAGETPEKLDEDVMERMLREQDLGLSDNDEVSSLRCLRLVFPSHMQSMYSFFWNSTVPGPRRKPLHGLSRSDAPVTSWLCLSYTVCFCLISATNLSTSPRSGDVWSLLDVKMHTPPLSRIAYITCVYHPILSQHKCRVNEQEWGRRVHTRWSNQFEMPI